MFSERTKPIHSKILFIAFVSSLNSVQSPIRLDHEVLRSLQFPMLKDWLEDWLEKQLVEECCIAKSVLESPLVDPNALPTHESGVYRPQEAGEQCSSSEAVSHVRCIEQKDSRTRE